MAHDKFEGLCLRGLVDASITWYLFVYEKRPITLPESLVTMTMMLPPLVKDFEDQEGFARLLTRLADVAKKRTPESISDLIESLFPTLSNGKNTAKSIIWQIECAAGMHTCLQGGKDTEGVNLRIKYLHMLRNVMASNPGNPDSVKKAAAYLPQIRVKKPEGYHCDCCKYHDADPPAPVYDQVALAAALDDMLATYRDDQMWSFTKKRPAPPQ